jgi:Holliday junction resolvasome RuvABC endonuclease subunit
LTQILLAIDPGFANMAIVSLEWQPKVRRCWQHWKIKTTPETPDAERWQLILFKLDEIIGGNTDVDFVACEDVTGVRHGKDSRGQSGSQSDPLLQVVGAIRMACFTHGLPLKLVRSTSVYAALGCRVSARSGETEEQKKKRQKLATQTAVQRLISGAESLSIDETDACAIGIACALGKGVIV